MVPMSPPPQIRACIVLVRGHRGRYRVVGDRGPERLREVVAGYPGRVEAGAA